MEYEVLTRTTTAKFPVFENVVPSHLMGSNSEKSVASIFGAQVKLKAEDSFETVALSLQNKQHHAPRIPEY
jgi:hypothetical protein